MKKHLCLLAASLLCVSIAIKAEESKRPPSQPEYSADSYTENSEMKLKEHIYVGQGKQRKEQDMGGNKTVSIIRPDKGVVWMLMPGDKMAMELGMQQAQAQQPGVDLADYQIERTEVGRETLNGIETMKYKVMMTGKNGKKLGGFQWVASPGIQVKLDAISKEGDSKERIKMELTNLQIGPQDPKLFEIPSDYTLMTMPAVPGMMGPGMRGMMPRGMGQD